jgi:hypothetical protein
MVVYITSWMSACQLGGSAVDRFVSKPWFLLDSPIHSAAYAGKFARLDRPGMAFVKKLIGNCFSRAHFFLTLCG